MSEHIEKKEYKGGVKTDEGKSVSRYNAISHGLLVKSITPYEEMDYKAVYEELESAFKPRNILEELMLERIAVAYVKLFRVTRAESEFIKSCLDPDIEMGMLSPILYKEGFNAKIKPEEFEKLTAIYSRYETNAENRMYKAMDRLLELKKMAI